MDRERPWETIGDAPTVRRHLGEYLRYRVVAERDLPRLQIEICDDAGHKLEKELPGSSAPADAPATTFILPVKPSMELPGLPEAFVILGEPDWIPTPPPPPPDPDKLKASAHPRTMPIHGKIAMEGEFLGRVTCAIEVCDHTGKVQWSREALVDGEPESRSPGVTFDFLIDV